MARLHISGKRLQINKANTVMIVAIALAAFLVTFSLVASKALLSQRAYQNRVIAEKQKALKQLKEDITASSNLMTAYQAFVGTSDNLLGGNPKGSGDHDGDNAKIVLDALPSKYDFPALASSLEKIISSKNYKLDSITGTDDEIGQANKAGDSPQPVEVPFQVGVSGTFDAMKDLSDIFERSIRPIKIRVLNVSGSNSELKVSITASTYYQPAKSLNIQTKEVK